MVVVSVESRVSALCFIKNRSETGYDKVMEDEMVAYVNDVMVISYRT